jgi:hypothetical protein
LVVDYVHFAEHLQEYHKGKEQAITAKNLLMFGTPREIRYLTNKARKEGFLICTSNRGYYYASNPEDVNGTINKLEAQVKECLEIIQVLRISKGGNQHE